MPTTQSRCRAGCGGQQNPQGNICTFQAHVVSGRASARSGTPAQRWPPCWKQRWGNSSEGRLWTLCNQLLRSQPPPPPLADRDSAGRKEAPTPYQCPWRKQTPQPARRPPGTSSPKPEQRGEASQPRAWLAEGPGPPGWPPQWFLSALTGFPSRSPAARASVSLTPSLFSFPLLFVPFYLWRVRLASRAGNDV